MKGALFIIGILFIAVFAVSGCQSRVEDNIVCNPPYIRHGLACCLDTNENSICDKDEGIKITPEEPEEEEEEIEEEEENEEEEEIIEIPEIAAKIEGFEDFDIVLATGSDSETDVIKMAIELATLIDYDSDIVTDDEFNILGYERIYLIKEKDEEILELNDFIIAVGDDASNSMVSKADDLAEGIDYTKDIKELDEVDFEKYKRAIYLVIES